MVKNHKSKIYGTTKTLSIENIKSFLRKHFQASASEIASHFGIGRATLFWYLKNQGYTLKRLKDEVLKEIEAEKERKLKRKQIKELPPRSFEEFLEYDSVIELKKRLELAPLSKKHKENIIRWVFDVCTTLNIAPSQINAETLLEYANKLKESDRFSDENTIRMMIKTIAKWLDIKLPAYVQISEYKGKYVTVEISREARKKFLEVARKVLDKKDYELLHDVVLVLFRGGRRESLKTMRFNGEIELPIKPYKFISFITEEKGHLGRKLKWNRLMPLEEYEKMFNPKRFPLSEKEVRRAETCMKKVFDVMLKQYPELFNKDTKEYLAKGKVNHVWRHTSAREYLKALNWNRYIVAKLLGWVKESNLSIYGDFSAIEIFQNYFRKEPEIPSFF